MSETDGIPASGPVGPPDPYRDGWRERPAAGFVGLAGPLWTRREANGWGYAFLAQERHTNPAGMVHGGMLLTLVDHAIATVAWEANGRRPCLTITLDTQFIAPVRPGTLVEARARVIRNTKSVVFMSGEVTVAGVTVLTASATLKPLASPGVTGKPAD